MHFQNVEIITIYGPNNRPKYLINLKKYTYISTWFESLSHSRSFDEVRIYDQKSGNENSRWSSPLFNSALSEFGSRYIKYSQNEQPFIFSLFPPSVYTIRRLFLFKIPPNLSSIFLVSYFELQNQSRIHSPFTMQHPKVNE